MSIYTVTDLTHRYPRQITPANDHLTFTVEEGEIFGLLGDNGAGKTTLVRQLAHLLAPTGGTIALCGRPLDHTALSAPGIIGYMPQSGHALNNLTIGETLYFTAHLRGLSRRDARAERDRLLDLLDLGACRHQHPARLSGGQKRLALLATTIAATPPVLLLDEPTNDLDPQHRRLVWDVVRDLNRERGVTVILVTHNVIEAERVIQRVAIMRLGKLVALGRPSALKVGLNDQLRLEMVFPPDAPPSLPNGSAPREIAPGRWSLLIDRASAPLYLAALNTVEDFTLSTASLEDLVLALT